VVVIFKLAVIVVVPCTGLGVDEIFNLMGALDLTRMFALASRLLLFCILQSKKISNDTR
jgi:hypothetical protein